MPFESGSLGCSSSDRTKRISFRLAVAVSRGGRGRDGFGSDVGIDDGCFRSDRSCGLFDGGRGTNDRSETDSTGKVGSERFSSRSCDGNGSYRRTSERKKININLDE
jgi:hypothetical protein